jgi:hypothetical protein
LNAAYDTLLFTAAPTTPTSTCVLASMAGMHAFVTLSTRSCWPGSFNLIRGGAACHPTSVLA